LAPFEGCRTQRTREPSFVSITLLLRLGFTIPKSRCSDDQPS
jgi:hypothetical protein